MHNDISDDDVVHNKASGGSKTQREEQESEFSIVVVRRVEIGFRRRRIVVEISIDACRQLLLGARSSRPGHDVHFALLARDARGRFRSARVLFSVGGRRGSARSNRRRSRGRCSGSWRRLRAACECLHAFPATVGLPPLARLAVVGSEQSVIERNEGVAVVARRERERAPQQQVATLEELVRRIKYCR